ncbi:MAG: hypothetical protein JXR70_09655, partial [Spirochaetales bacterium]|nr:hypothetical protein [Spirochaetales bacterium]
NAAEKLAKDILVRNAREFVRATGESEGNIEIRAGSILRIEAVGQRMSNCYQVVAVQHIIDAATHGYVTKFDLVSNVASDTSDSSSSDSSSSQSDEQEEQAQNEPQNSEDETTEESTTTTTEKNPAITNLKWLDDEGNEITEAYLGDEVVLTSDVQDIDASEKARFFLYKIDGENNEDPFIKRPSQVKNLMIQLEYRIDEKYEIAEDSWETKVDEYKFEIECKKHEIITNQSPVLDIHIPLINIAVDIQDTAELKESSNDKLILVSASDFGESFSQEVSLETEGEQLIYQNDNKIRVIFKDVFPDKSYSCYLEIGNIKGSRQKSYIFYNKRIKKQHEYKGNDDE